MVRIVDGGITWPVLKSERIKMRFEYTETGKNYRFSPLDSYKPKNLSAEI